MRWDRTRILPVESRACQYSASLLWVSDSTLPVAISKACDLAGIEVLRADNLGACLSFIVEKKPDILLQDVFLTRTWKDFECQVGYKMITASLPILDYEPRPTDLQTLGPESNTIDALLTIRGILRRERPAVLNDIRHVGDFTLDESSFRLFHGKDLVGISKTDLCLLGPFFDIADTVFDRQSIARLAFGTAYNYEKIRTVDAQISRMRRHVRFHIGVDPLRPVRHVGYALAGTKYLSTS